MRDHYVIILKHFCATGSEHQKSKSNRPSNTVLWQETWEIVYYSPFRISTRKKNQKKKLTQRKLAKSSSNFFASWALSFTDDWKNCVHLAPVAIILANFSDCCWSTILQYFFYFFQFMPEICDRTLTSNPWYVILVRTMVTQISNQMSSQSDNAAANAGGANSSSNRYVYVDECIHDCSYQYCQLLPFHERNFFF